MKNPYLEKYNRNTLKRPLKGCRIGCLTVLGILIIAFLVMTFFCKIYRYPVGNITTGEDSVAVYRIGKADLSARATFEVKLNRIKLLEFDCQEDIMCTPVVGIQEAGDHALMITGSNDEFELKIKLLLEGDSQRAIWWYESHDR